MSKKTYRIPVVYQMWGPLDVKAESIEAAINFARSKDAGLPAQAKYIEDSFQVDEENELIGEFNKDALTEADKEFLKNRYGNTIMSMGYAGSSIIAIDEKVIAKYCPKELKAFNKLKAQFGKYATFSVLNGNYAISLTKEDEDAICAASDKLVKAFRKKTGLEISYFYHDAGRDGDRYDDIGEAWQVHNAYHLTTVAKPFAKSIRHYSFVVVM